MTNVIGLDGKEVKSEKISSMANEIALSIEDENNFDMVLTLEQVMSMVKEGKIISLAVVAVTKDGYGHEAIHAPTLASTMSLIGQLEVCKTGLALDAHACGCVSDEQHN